MAEELRAKLGLDGLCSVAQWPTYDPAMLVDDTIELPVQIRGKVKAKIIVPAEADKAAIEAAALADAQVQALLDGATPQRVIVVPGKIINIIP